nr:replication-associated recombination protein A [Actinomycetota bacterium]
QNEGYGIGYRYAHDDASEGMNDHYLPETLKGRIYYDPKDRGIESRIKARLDRWRAERDGRSEES